MNTPIITTETTTGFSVWVNSDRTEGKGRQYPMCVCSEEATAIRLAKSADVQGTDGSIYPRTIFKIDGEWYGPIDLVPPTAQDSQKQALLEKIQKAKAKAAAAGLTKDEIELLTKTI